MFFCLDVIFQFFKVCFGKEANIISLGFCLLSLSIAIPRPLSCCANVNIFCFTKLLVLCYISRYSVQLIRNPQKCFFWLFRTCVLIISFRIIINLIYGASSPFKIILKAFFSSWAFTFWLLIAMGVKTQLLYILLINFAKFVSKCP